MNISSVDLFVSENHLVARLRDERLDGALRRLRLGRLRREEAGREDAAVDGLLQTADLLVKLGRGVLDGLLGR